MKNILFTLAFSFFLIGAFAQNTSLSSYYNNGELIVLSQDKNATVQAITPELRPGKEIGFLFRLQITPIKTTPIIQYQNHL